MKLSHGWDALALGGLAAILYGLFAIWTPLGWLGLGGLALAAGLLGALVRRGGGA